MAQRENLKKNKAAISLNLSWQRIKKALKDDELHFRWATTLKLISISIVTAIVIGAFLATVLKMDLLFFEANGLVNFVRFEETFYEFFFNKLSNRVAWFFLFFAGVLLIGMYISKLLLRPFEIISTYCEKKLEGQDVSYDPDFFTDLKVLTRFSEFFFNHINAKLKSGECLKVEVPKKYTKIHKPVFEKGFFLQYLLFILMTSICTSVGLYVLTVELHESILELSHEALKQGAITTKFLINQSEILNYITFGVLFSHILTSCMLAIHLYYKISAPAFGIFATMRAFLKGNHGARVHLVGHYFLRPHCRILNRYLDYVQKEAEKNSLRSIKKD